MLRNILINKWILSGIALLIIVSVSCYFWYQHEVSSYNEKVNKTEEMVHQKEITNTADTDNLTQDKTKTAISDTSAPKRNVSDVDIEKFLKDIAAEGKISETDVENLIKGAAVEEKEEVKEPLSAEEIAERENKQKEKELWKRIGKIMQDAGGSIHSSTHPEEMREVIRLFEEGAGGPTIFTEMNNMAMMFQNSVDSNGNIQTSELLKLADYHESVLESKDSEFSEILAGSAVFLRNLALYASIKGYDEINLQEIINKQDEIEKVLMTHYESME